MTGKILMIEDDVDLGIVTQQYLISSGFDTTLATTCRQAEELCSRQLFDLLIVDVQLPDDTGFELVSQLLESYPEQRFVFLTARNNKESKIQGLKLGGDDYITKPFDIEELSWRIHNIINRQQVRRSADLYIGDIRLVQDQMMLVFQNDHQVNLTEREFEVWKYFALNANRVLKREDILLAVWGENDYFLGRSLDVFVSRIRKLLSHSNNVQLETVFKVGFIFRAPNT
ncbi:response regulator transcription factor [Sphingobacterium sp. SYP-B4668]|uniref:response regulator transcription factor n=1 Tax=Sphingobacterium sp. SYP-B4668 TaxID=2996035 RepID=UPI0022DD9798|nr:response regulator transcription factor [Sphingobacterium sp. SYP-B4668]